MRTENKKIIERELYKCKEQKEKFVFSLIIRLDITRVLDP